MLPRARRLSSLEVERLMKSGRAVSVPPLRAKFLPSVEGNRFAFVVSKKISGNAILRNKLRRWASESVRALPTLPRADVAVMVGKRYEALSEMRTDMGALISRVVKEVTRT